MNTKLGARASKNAKSGTDWVALKDMHDSSIKFTQDAPQTTPVDWAAAVTHRGLPLPAKKEQIALRILKGDATLFRSA
jgi:hypothetical protein